MSVTRLAQTFVRSADTFGIAQVEYLGGETVVWQQRIAVRLPAHMVNTPQMSVTTCFAVSPLQGANEYSRSRWPMERLILSSVQECFDLEEQWRAPVKQDFEFSIHSTAPSTYGFNQRGGDRPRRRPHIALWRDDDSPSAA
jgi:hypothetical protein